MNWLVVGIIAKYKKMKTFKKGDKITGNGTPIFSGNPSLASNNKVELIITAIGNSNNGVYGTLYSLKTLKGVSAGQAYASEIKLVSCTVKDLEGELKALEKSKSELENKISIMKKFDMEEYDENVVKAHSVLELIGKDKLSNVDKAKLIAKLINSEE
jgi:hypothetical protein